MNHATELQKIAAQAAQRIRELESLRRCVEMVRRCGEQRIEHHREMRVGSLLHKQAQYDGRIDEAAWYLVRLEQMLNGEKVSK